MRIGVGTNQAARGRAATIDELIEQVATYADVAIVGSEADVERQLAEIERAGGTELNASVFGSAEEQQRTFEFLHTQVANVRSTPV